MNNRVTQFPSPEGDINHILRDVIKDISNDNINKANIIACFFKDKLFLQYLKNEIGDINPVQADIDKLKVVLNNWMRKTHPSVTATAAKVENDPLDEFSSSKAKSLAIADIANRILEANIINENRGSEKNSSGRVLTSVKASVRDTFLDTYFPTCYSRVGITDTQIDDLTAQAKNIKTKLEEFNAKEDRGEELTEDEENQADELDAEYKRINLELLTLKLNYALKHGTVQERNFAVYTNNILTDPQTWLRKGFKLKKLYSLSKKYGYRISAKYLNGTTSEEQGNSIEEDNRFTEEQDKYNSHLQLIDNDLKIYISTLANLNEVWDGEKPILYDTDNELGVATRMNAGFVINNIISRCDFSGGIDGLIRSLEKLVSSKKQLFGISVMIDKMKKDHEFARQVFYGLGNPIVGKLMINIENNINIRRSNNEANARLNLLFTLSNRLKGSFTSFYKTNLMEGINAIGPKNSDDMNINLIYRYLNGFFPGIDGNAIKAYIKADKTKIKEKINEFKSILTTFNESADNMMKIINKSKGYDYGFESMLPAISKIVDTLLPYTVVSTELNSSNAQGNMSSDVLNNNFISNTLKQIQFGTEENANAGLQKLLDFVSKSPQYKYSPIFWGIVDANGKRLTNGLFVRDKNGNESINPKAKELIKVNLFNGISNPLDNAGELYSSMSRADYFMSSLIAFNSKFREQTTNEDQTPNNIKTGNIFLRIPSDAPKNFIVTVPIISTGDILKNGKIDTNHKMVHAFRQVILNELNTFIENLNNIYNIDGTLKTDTNGLFGNYHYKGEIFKDGKLTGNVFNFSKLASYDGFNYNELMQSILSLYTGNKKALIAKNGSLNLKRTDIIRIDGDRFAIAGNNILTNELNSVIEKYLEAAILDANLQTQQYKAIIGEKYDSGSIINTVLNTNLAYTYFDDLFEGDAKFYKNPQTFLKRAKEVQAGGMAYDNWSTNDTIGGDIVNSTDLRGQAITYEIAGRTYYVKNGFKAVTINNTVRPSDYAKTIEERLLHLDVPAATVKDIVKRFAGDTITNDAQSYITIEELANRLFAKGQLTKYKPLLDKFMAKKEDGSPADVTAEDLKELSGLVEKIRVQKNFYFDKQFDITTKTVYPRQIKNAEFVLIPQLLGDSSLRTLYDIMIENNIGQINTAEADKAAQRYILTFWDNNGKVTDESIANFEKELANGNGRAVENYYYRYLYEQRQVAQHMENEQNKASIQMMKKILDNAGVYSDNVRKNVKIIFDKYVENIEDSFNEMLDNMNWKVNEHGQIVNKDDSTELDFKEFYKLGQDEARRLGMDSNFLSYFEFDKKGHAILPNFMNLVQTKLESIAQNIFNHLITRQELPGFQAVQVTNVGMDNKLSYLADLGNPYVEIRVTPWFPAEVDGKSVTLEELIDAEVDYMIGYRIPTEGKQSIAVFRATELLDRTQGSTIVVPDEWVTQTGSDFDIDSVYTITYKFKRNENGKLVKIKEGRDGRNNEILDAMIAIMQDPAVMEENLSCSNFDEIQDNIDYFNSINPQIASSNESVYNLFTQMKYFENATSGMALKAQSAIRDNFASINSYVRSEINKRDVVTVEYDLNNSLYDKKTIQDAFEHVKIDEERNVAIVTHNRLANSKNNRNVVGRLMTVYSSQTTAHTREAIRIGVIFNETLYTFGSFKTLIDLGIDYRTAIAFLQQPAISNIVENYNKHKSIYSKTNYYDTKPIHDAIRHIAKVVNIKIHGKEINEFTNIQNVCNALLQDKKLTSAFKELFGNDLNFDKSTKHNYIRLNGKALEIRIKQGKIIETGKDKEANDNYKKLAYDLGMTLFFSHLKSITKSIENIAQVSNPDKFGALQNVAATRNKIKTIKNIITDKQASGYNFLSIKGNNFIEAIYPGILNNKIDISKSAYPYLAAFIKYSTLSSISVNSKLFLLENESMTKMYNAIENRIGKKLTEAQQKEYWQYLVAQIYNNTGALIRPLTIDEQGMIDYDTKLEKQDSTNNTTNSCNLERGRILGYRVTEDYNFLINDIYNPTEEEYNIFKCLTPIQKILFIRKHFIQDAGIFSYLETNEFKDGGIIKFKETTDDIDNLYILMNEAFFNTNRLIRLTAIDLIKYAFIAEQGRYQKGNISKLITPQILLADNRNFGFNFSNKIIEKFNDLCSNIALQNTILDRYIRSHPNVIDTIDSSRINCFGIESEGIYLINSLDKKTLDFIKYSKRQPDQYFRIKRNIKIENRYGYYVKTEVKLYKAQDKGEFIYLYPITELNKKDAEYGIDDTKEKIDSDQIYKSIIQAIFCGNFTSTKNRNRETNLLIGHNNCIDKNYINDKLKSSDSIERQQAKDIVNDIANILKNPIKTGAYDGIFPTSAEWLKAITPKHGLRITALRQDIEIDGVIHHIAISLYENFRLKNFFMNKYKRIPLSKTESPAVNLAIERKITNPLFFGVTIITDDEQWKEVFYSQIE